MHHYPSPLDFLLLDWLEDLDHALGVVKNVHTFKYFTVLSPTDFAHDFIVLLVTPVYHQALVVPVLSRPKDIHVRVHPAQVRVYNETRSEGVK